MLQSYRVGWGGVGGPCDFSVSPRSKSFFFIFWGTFIRLGGLLGQGLGLGLGPGLDNNFRYTRFMKEGRSTILIDWYSQSLDALAGACRPVFEWPVQCSVLADKQTNYKSSFTLRMLILFVQLDLPEWELAASGLVWPVCWLQAAAQPRARHNIATSPGPSHWPSYCQ